MSKGNVYSDIYVYSTHTQGHTHTHTHTHVHKNISIKKVNFTKRIIQLIRICLQQHLSQEIKNEGSLYDPENNLHHLLYWSLSPEHFLYRRVSAFQIHGMSFPLFVVENTYVPIGNYS